MIGRARVTVLEKQAIAIATSAATQTGDRAWAFFVTPTIVEVVGSVRRRPFFPIVDCFAWLIALLGQGIVLGAIL